MHDAEVRVADEAVVPLLQSQHEALCPREFHAGENTIEARSTQVEVVNVRLVADDKAIGRSGLQFREGGAAELKGVPGEWRLYSVDGGTGG